MTPRLYSTSEACAILRCSKQTLYRLDADKTITSVQYRPGGKRYWPADTVDALADPDPKRRKPGAAQWRPRKKSA